MSSRKGSSGNAVSVSSKCPHLGQQNRRRTTSGWTFVPAPGSVATATARQVAAALGRSDVLLYTSRAVVGASHGRAARDYLTIARTVSGALASIARQALASRPAWIIAKGGITAHDVAVRGLGIRRAEVAGQLFPGLISVVGPAYAAHEAIGMPYVVFPGNVGDDHALTRVVAILNGADAAD